MSVVRLYGDRALKDARRAIETGWWHDIPVVPSETYDDYPCEIWVNDQLMPIVPMRGSKTGIRQARCERINEYQIAFAEWLGARWARAYKKKPVLFIKAGAKRRGALGLGASCHNGVIENAFRGGFDQEFDRGNVSIGSGDRVCIRNIYADGVLCGVVAYHTSAGKGVFELLEMLEETVEWEQRFAA